MNFLDRYEQWITDSYFDEETRNELISIKEDTREIEERFYKDLEFGTGGLRGIIGAGTNRMNIYTVGRATQGLANFLKEENPNKALSIAVAYDPRNMSIEFAQSTALVMAANGIKAYVFDELRPTPELSFALRHLGCDAGVVITASHNPPEYNGYKVYGNDGGQVPYPKDGYIIDKVNAIEKYSDVKFISMGEAIEKGLYEVIGEEVDKAYIEELKKQCINCDLIDKMADKVKIVYTPLHGTGNKPVRRVLEEVGYKHVSVVPEQELPDGNFTTVGYPNPEDPKVFKLAMEIAKKEDADVIIGTDPDADRIGVVVKNSEGEYVVLSGNMMGALVTEYLLSQRKENGTLGDKGAVIKTIVTTDMVQPIAKNYGATVFDVLTGFKYIGEKIKEFEETNEYTYEFGFEESYGCLIGTHARDKDAVVAAMIICEIVAFYKNKDMTLYDGLVEMYEKYGYYKEDVNAITLKGLDGIEKIKNIMAYLRQNPLTEVCGDKVTWVKDYTTKEFTNMVTGEKEENLLPPSNVLRYTLENDKWICVRPSGTEPKLKVYYGVKGESMEDANEKGSCVSKFIGDIIDGIF